MNGEGDFFDETLDMMASGFDNVFPMPGDGSYQCPRCGRVGTRDDFSGTDGAGKKVVRCPECGREIPF